MRKEILEWAKPKGLLNPDFAPKQFIKLVEEVGELANAILKNNKAEQIDALGDIQIVLNILAEQLGFDLDECLKSAYEEIKNRTGKTINGTFIKD
jgi:NTP pyrophosphatase (non-canonical NTP hydrolase)